MRRKDRAIMDPERISAIMEKCSVCSLAFAGSGYPYVIPLNFGEKTVDGRTVLYFHGAGEGIKFDRLREDNRVAFSMYAAEELALKEPACSTTMLYESVCGVGKVFPVDEAEEKLEALKAIMRHYDKNHREFDFAVKAVEKTAVLRLEVEEMTGKTNRI